MKSVFFILFSLFCLNYSFSQTPSIIPLPNHFQKVDAAFELSNQTTVDLRNAEFKAEADYLKQQFLDRFGYTAVSRTSNASKIVLDLKKNLKKEAYELKIEDKKVQISASDREGIFNGIISFLQLASNAPQKDASILIPAWNITDQPLYEWRGFMLDEARHFFGKVVVKQLLDQMAWLKLNKFHWHLTDEQGWRLQIKRYPYLSLIGGIGNFSDSLAPAKYYTQEDIAEVVAYAKQRHIEVIPEIDMPGHATAANRAYPQFSGGGTGKYANFTFNPGNEKTYDYLNNILKEVAVLFPSKMVHLGGDEVSFGIQSWNQNPEVQTLMKQKDLTDLKQVEGYFFNRMADNAWQSFDKVLAWDEAVDNNLPVKNSLIFWWRHDKPDQLNKALDKGYQVVVCPRIPLYFDFVQDARDQKGRRWDKAFNPLEKVYRFSPVDLIQNKKEVQQVLGLQANLWTETVQSKERLDYLIFPRITAVAETAWTNPENKNYEDFLQRLKPQLKRYQQEGIYYYDVFNPQKSPEIIQ